TRCRPDLHTGEPHRRSTGWLEMFSHRCIIHSVLTLTDRHDALHRLGRALGDPGRCNILVALLDGPRYPGELADALEMSRTNMSNHLACLRGCGLVTATAEGRQVRYEISHPNLAHAIRDLLDVVLATDCDH